MSRNTIRTIIGAVVLVTFTFILPMALYFRSLLSKEFAIGVVIIAMIALVAIGCWLYRQQQRELHEQDWNDQFSSGYDRFHNAQQKGARSS